MVDIYRLANTPTVNIINSHPPTFVQHNYLQTGSDMQSNRGPRPNLLRSQNARMCKSVKTTVLGVAFSLIFTFSPVCQRFCNEQKGYIISSPIVLASDCLYKCDEPAPPRSLESLST